MIRRQLQILLLVGFGAILSRPVLAQKTNMRAPSTAQSLVVNSNAETATVLRNGFSLGNVGQAVDIETGEHDLIVTSPGYVPRTIRVKIDSAKQTVLIVNLAKIPPKRSVNADDFDAAWKFQAKRSVVDLKSLCLYVKPSVLPDAFRYANKCQRQSWFDDIERAGHSWMHKPDLSALDAGGRTLVQSMLAERQLSASEDWYRKSEGLFGMWPGDITIYSMLAKSALMRADCGRVYLLMHEHGMHGIVGMPLRVLAAHCMELEGRDDQAIGLLRQAQKAGMPEASYHLARILFTKDPVAGAAELKVCVKSHPTYLPCVEALALSLLKSQRQRLADTVFDNYDQAVIRVVQPFYQGPLSQSSKLSYEQRVDAIKVALLAAPFSYTLNWELLLTYLERQKIKPSEFRNYVGEVHLSDVKSARRLVKRIRALGSSEYLEDLYWHFTEKFPRNPVYWLRLAQIQKRKRGCGAALAVAEKAIAKNLKSVRGIYTLKGDCLVALGKYQQAEQIFRILIKDDPDNWKPFWNLGIVMEEMGDRAKSMYYYREALVREPPEQHSMQLLRKIEYMERVKAEAD